jgi:hypothetical protein
MRRREFIALMGASVAWPIAAMAQQTGRTYRLGCLWAPPRDAPITIAFFDELRRRGFIEGQNLIVEFRTFGQHPELVSQYAAELVKARPDILTTAGEETVLALQQATKTIPIVAIVSDTETSTTDIINEHDTRSFRPGCSFDPADEVLMRLVHLLLKPHGVRSTSFVEIRPVEERYIIIDSCSTTFLLAHKV